MAFFMFLSLHCVEETQKARRNGEEETMFLLVYLGVCKMYVFFCEGDKLKGSSKWKWRPLAG
jgi:hypothetical protein